MNAWIKKFILAIGLCIISFVHYAIFSFCQWSVHEDLTIAAYNGDLKEVKRLVNFDMNISGSSPDMHFTPLEGAINSDHDDIVLYLLERGADPNAEGNYGRRALSGAIRKGKGNTMRILLDHGAHL